MVLKNSSGYRGSGVSAAVSSHIVHIYESHHTKGETWNSLLKAVAPLLQKRPHPPPPLQKFLEEFSKNFKGFLQKYLLTIFKKNINFELLHSLGRFPIFF